MSNRGTGIFAAVTCGTLALAFIGGAVHLGPASSVGGSPSPTPTVTVTATTTASPEPQPTPRATLPPECVIYLADSLKLPPLLDAYEKSLAQTETMQDTGIQGMMRNNIVILNRSRQQLIDIKNESVGYLEALYALQNALSAEAKLCAEASTP